MAVAYAPAAARAGLTALFALDERLGGIVSTTGEPMIGLMRLAWWREALEKLDAAPPPAEPLLRRIAGSILPSVSGMALAGIEDGWAALLDGEANAEAVARHGRERGETLFGCAWQLLSADHDEGVTTRLRQCGHGWALADLAHRHSMASVRAEARRQAVSALTVLDGVRWPRRARPLAALAVLARRDVRDDRPRRQGGPARLLRMLALNITGG